jgi:hypothetical protein
MSCRRVEESKRLAAFKPAQYSRRMRIGFRRIWNHRYHPDRLFIADKFQAQILAQSVGFL